MMGHNLKSYAIVADIGGTFARFARVNLDTLVMDKIEIYACAAYTGFASALLAYQEQHLLESLKQVALAIACPVGDDLIQMTNCHWCFSIHEVKQKLGLLELIVLNDFSAIAMSLPVLAEHEITQVGKGCADKSKVWAVLGAGTGLGVAWLVPNQQGYIAYGGEGGHVSWGATTEQEWFIYTYLKKIYAHLSYERLLSGHGLENLYKALAAYHHQDEASLPAAQIIALALTQQSTTAQAAVAQFFAILGSYAGDLALTFAAFGGVYIAGGIVPRLLPMIHQSDFRACFESKGRFSNFTVQIPTYVIRADQPGLLGTAVYLKQFLASKELSLLPLAGEGVAG